MSVRFEWVDSNDCGIDVVPKNYDVNEWDVVDEEDEDVREDVTDGPSIIIGSEAPLVITGETYADLERFAGRLLHAVRKAGK